MTERVRELDHRGVRVVLVDFSHLGPENAEPVIEQAERFIARFPPGSVRLMTDVTGARYNRAVVERLRRFAAHNTPYVRASAVVGLAPLHRAIHAAVQLFVKRRIEAFPTRQAALDWLAQQG